MESIFHLLEQHLLLAHPAELCSESSAQRQEWKNGMYTGSSLFDASRGECLSELYSFNGRSFDEKLIRRALLQSIKLKMICKFTNSVCRGFLRKLSPEILRKLRPPSYHRECTVLSIQFQTGDCMFLEVCREVDALCRLSESISLDQSTFVHVAAAHVAKRVQGFRQNPHSGFTLGRSKLSQDNDGIVVVTADEALKVAHEKMASVCFGNQTSCKPPGKKVFTANRQRELVSFAHKFTKKFNDAIREPACTKHVMCTGVFVVALLPWRVMRLPESNMMDWIDNVRRALWKLNFSMYWLSVGHSIRHRHNLEAATGGGVEFFRVGEAGEVAESEAVNQLTVDGLLAGNPEIMPSPNELRELVYAARRRPVVETGIRAMSSENLREFIASLSRDVTNLLRCY